MIRISATHLKSIDLKTKGLLGQKKAKNVYFETCWGIHTFFLKFPIDVVILDKKSTVVKLKRSLKPNRIFLWNPRFYRVLELASGEIEKKEIGLCSTIDLALY